MVFFWLGEKKTLRMRLKTIIYKSGVCCRCFFFPSYEKSYDVSFFLSISLAREVGWESNMEVEDSLISADNEASFQADSAAVQVMAAILDGKLLRLKSLLGEGDFTGEMLPMLEAAARSGDVEILKFLCQKLGGQRVNLRCCCGWGWR